MISNVSLGFQSHKCRGIWREGQGKNVFHAIRSLMSAPLKTPYSTCIPFLFCFVSRVICVFPLICVCTCVCCVCPCECVYLWVQVSVLLGRIRKRMLGIPLHRSLPSMLEKGSHRTWSEAGSHQPQWASCLCSYSRGYTGVCDHTQLCMWVLGIWIQILSQSELSSAKCSSPLRHLPVTCVCFKVEM